MIAEANDRFRTQSVDVECRGARRVCIGGQQVYGGTGNQPKVQAGDERCLKRIHSTCIACVKVWTYLAHSGKLLVEPPVVCAIGTKHIRIATGLSCIRSSAIDRAAISRNGEEDIYV